MRRALLLICAMAAAQTADPVSDKLRADILKAHRDQLAAEKDKQVAMMAYNVAESRYEAASHDLTLLRGVADRVCAPGKFDLDKAVCVK